jgi:hypothetical protein
MFSLTGSRTVLLSTMGVHYQGRLEAASEYVLLEHQ